MSVKPSNNSILEVLFIMIKYPEDNYPCHCDWNDPPADMRYQPRPPLRNREASQSPWCVRSAIISAFLISYTLLFFCVVSLLLASFLYVVCLSVCTSIYISICLSIYLSLSMYLSVCLSLCIYQSFYYLVSIYLSESIYYTSIFVCISIYIDI